MVTYISGRRSFEQYQPIQLIKEFVNNKEVDNQNHHSTLSFTLHLQIELGAYSNSCPSYVDNFACLMRAVGESVDSDPRGDQELMAGAVRGAGEYLDTGDITETWRHLRQYPHVNTVVKCLQRAKTCNY